MREVRSHGFDLYSIPAPAPASAADMEALREALSRASGLGILAQRERGGETQSLITAMP